MKKVVLSVVMLIYSVVGFSQAENSNVDSKVKFGFNLGENFSILQSKEPLPTDAEIYNGFGFKLGVFMDYSLSNNLFLSPKTELSFNNSGLETVNSSTTTHEAFPITLEVMTHVVYKIGNGKRMPYVLVGPNYRLPLDVKSNSSTEFKTSSDFAIDLGFGVEHMFKHFNFAPELRYSMGFLDVNENPTFKTLRYHNVSLMLNFK